MPFGTHPCSVDKAVVALVQGLRSYFNDILGLKLLYKLERAQHDQLVRESNASLCDIYGGEHLLRLLVKLPGFLAASCIDEAHAAVVKSKLLDLARFLESNPDMFASTYRSIQTKE